MRVYQPISIQHRPFWFSSKSARRGARGTANDNPEAWPGTNQLSAVFVTPVHD